jgi:hypothetical protein
MADFSTVKHTGAAFKASNIEVHNRQLAANQPHKEHNFFLPLQRYDFVRLRFLHPRAPTRRSAEPARALVRGTPKRVAGFTPSEIDAAPARQVLRTRVVEVGDA